MEKVECLEATQTLELRQVIPHDDYVRVMRETGESRIPSELNKQV